ncbi:MAG TPA: type II CAAX endopeptidase family protein [Thermoanaerobaculia bacterium]|nr:type II CAAX endopeptidase family protein [Thermoanaerobaculia bacterium]
MEETTPRPLEPSPPPPPVRSPARSALALFVPVLRAVLYLVAYIAVQIVITLPLRAFAHAVNGGGLFKPGGFGTANEAFLVTVVLSIPLQILVTWLFVRFLDRRTLASIGARWPLGGRRAALRQLAAASLGAVAVLGIWLALTWALPDALAAIHYAGVSAEYTRSPAWWPLPPILLLLVLLLGFILQGGLEEWIIRGYIYHTLRQRWRPWVSALGSSMLFAMLHAANPAVSGIALLNIVLAGMVLAALVERTGSLWSATLAHGVWNFAVACLLSVQVSGVRLFHLLDVKITGNPDLTGGGFGPEGSALLTLIGIGLMILLWRGMWRRQSERAEAVMAPVITVTLASAPEDASPLLSP